MLPREVIRQIRRLQVRARRAVENLVGGEYHSVFRGMGISFEEVREYQPGDDIRTIDWNVTARMGHPFIKRYIEDRELTVVLVVDCSASHQFGTERHLKREVIAELAAVLALARLAIMTRSHWCHSRTASRNSFRRARELVTPCGSFATYSSSSLRAGRLVFGMR